MKKYIFFALFICANLEINAQANFSFNNLRDYVAQTQNINPVSLPNNTFTFGFPLNFSTNVYSDIKIKDFLTKNGNSLKLDLANLNDLAKIKNYLNLNTNISLAILSHKTKKGAFSFFANAKSNLNWKFSNNFTDVLSNGFENGFVFSNEKIQFTAYTEMGIGITRLFRKDKLAVGFRVKFLNGIAHAESLDDAYFSLDVNPENANWTIQASNVVLNT